MPPNTSKEPWTPLQPPQPSTKEVATTGPHPNLTKSGKGRPKGSKNKVNTLLKEAILLAAADVGDQIAAGTDEEGGLRAYLRNAAVTETKAFLALLGRILPTEAKGDPDHPVVEHVTIEFIPPDKYRNN